MCVNSRLKVIAMCLQVCCNAVNSKLSCSNNRPQPKPFLTEIFLPLCFDRHEDGTVRFWDASGVALTPIYKLSTANVFHTDCDPCDDPQDSGNDPDMQQEEEWPPFRKVRAEAAEGSVTHRHSASGSASRCR